MNTSLTTLAMLSALTLQPFTATADRGIRPASVRVHEAALAYVVAGRTDGPRILFLHGTPGSWQAFRGFLEDEHLRSAAELVAVDRPGFGNSATRVVVPGLKQQSRLLEPLLAGSRPTIIVGHSLGGSIAYQLAIDYPNRVKGLVVISSSISPDLGKPRWYNHMAAVVPFLLPGEMRKANLEIMPLQEDLATLKPALDTIRIPVKLLHGDRDALVSVQNLAYARAHLRNAALTVIRVPDAGHFLLWEHPELVRGAIYSALAALP